MRELSRKRKDRIEEDRAREERERDEERKKKDKERQKAAQALAKKKDEKDNTTMDQASRPPAVGAHGLARQDGASTHKGLASSSFSRLSPCQSSY